MSRMGRYARFDVGRRPVIVPVTTWAHLTLDGLGGFGAADLDIRAILPEAAKAYAQYEAAAEPKTQVELLKAKISNMKAMRERMPIAAIFYDNEIAKLQARLRAAQSKLGVAKEGEQAKRDWRSLGFAVSGVGILIGVSLLGLVIAKTIKASRG